MLSLALATLRSRWTAFAVSLAALALGVAVIATMAQVIAAAAGDPHGAPQRYAAVPEVIQADPYLHYRDRYGAADDVLLPAQPGLSAPLAAAYPGAVADRTFYAQLSGGPAGQVGHPWSAAAFTPYRMTAGRPPAGPGQIVVGGGAPGLVGRRVDVITSGQTGRYLVSGVTAGVPFEHAIFFSDSEAARLSSRVDALVPSGPARAVPGTRLLAGAARREADPGYRADTAALSSLESFMGIAALLAGTVTLYVTASIFGLSVTQRRRELALLRLTGGTPAQVMRMVCGEALIVGAIGAAAGCALGMVGGPALATWMARNQLAPAWFSVGPRDWLVALPAALAAGTAVAVLSVALTALRAGKLQPVAALRAAAVDDRPPAPIRLLAGVGTLLAGAGLLAAVAFALPSLAADLKTDVTAVLLIVAGTALLAPALIAGLAALIRLPGWTGMLAKCNTRTGLRRSCAVVTPVLFTVGVAAAILGATALQQAAAAAQQHQQVPPGGFVVVPGRTPGLATAAVHRIAALPGAATPVTDTIVLARQPSVTPLHLKAPAPIPFPALAVSGTQAIHLPVLSGSLAGLNATTVAIDTTWNLPVGSTLHLWLADGTPKNLRVIAVFRAGLEPGVVLASGNAAAELTSRIYVAPGADLTEITAAARADGASVLPVARWQAAVTTQQDRQNRAGLVVLLGIATCYSAITIAAAFMMSVTTRRREWKQLRLTGATRRQMIQLAATEALLLGGIGLVLAAAAAATVLLALGRAFSDFAVVPAGAQPWRPVLALAAGSLLIAVASAVLAVPRRPA